MDTYRKLLVAIDLVADSRQVLQAAVDMAEHQAVDITVLHVTQRAASIYGQAVNERIHIKDNQQRESLFAQVAELTEQVGLGREHIRISFGQPVTEIINMARKEQSDLIIIGSHGRHGVKLLLGGTANAVLHHAPCDVLAVRIT